jgi:hypothetical protein
MGEYKQYIRSASMTKADDEFWNTHPELSFTEEVRKMTKELREKEEGKA